MKIKRKSKKGGSGSGAGGKHVRIKLCCCLLYGDRREGRRSHNLVLESSSSRNDLFWEQFGVIHCVVYSFLPLLLLSSFLFLFLLLLLYFRLALVGISIVHFYYFVFISVCCYVFLWSPLTGHLDLGLAFSFLRDAAGLRRAGEIGVS